LGSNACESGTDSYVRASKNNKRIKYLRTRLWSCWTKRANLKVFKVLAVRLLQFRICGNINNLGGSLLRSL
jgi:hypothetical protein